MTVSKKILLLFAITFLTYLPSFWNQFVWDDEQFIYKNQYVLNFNVAKIFTENTIAGSGQQSDYYRPLTTLSFAVDHAIWGLTPFGFHLTNTLLHISAGVVLYLLLTELGLKGKKNKIFSDFAFWISLIFLVHPIQTEAVVYVNSRGDSLFTLLGLLSLYALTISFRKKPIKIGNFALNHIYLAILSVVFYILSMLSKEIGVMIAILHLQILIVQLIKSNQKIKNHLLQISTTISVILSAIGYLILRSTILNFVNSFNPYRAQNEYTSSLLMRLLTFSKVNLIYFKLLLFPHPLHMERDVELVKSIASIWPWALIILYTIVFLLGVFERKKEQTSWIWFGMIWMMVSLAPVSGILPINGLIYEHWLYVPMIGFFITLFKIAQILLSNIKMQQLRLIKKAGLLLIAVILSILTIKQNWIWRTPISFYTYQLQYSTSARMLNNLAMAYSDIKNHQKAIEYYTKAIDFADMYPQTHYNLGNTYIETNQLDLAEKELNKAIKMSKDFDFAYGPLINLYLQQQNFEPILPLINHLIERYPTDAQLMLIKLNVLLKLNKAKEAESLSKDMLSKSNFNPQVKKIIEQIYLDNLATSSAQSK